MPSYPPCTAFSDVIIIDAHLVLLPYRLRVLLLIYCTCVGIFALFTSAVNEIIAARLLHMSNVKCFKCCKNVAGPSLSCPVCLEFFHPGCCKAFLKYKSAGECCTNHFGDLFENQSVDCSTSLVVMNSRSFGEQIGITAKNP